MWDILFICLIAAAAWAGYRRGALQAAATVIGLLVGISAGGAIAEAFFPPQTLQDVILHRCAGILVVSLGVGTLLSIGAHYLNKRLPEHWKHADHITGALIRGGLVLISLGTLWSVITGMPPDLLPQRIQNIRSSAPMMEWVGKHTPIRSVASQAPKLVPIPSLQTPLKEAPASVARSYAIVNAAKSVVRIRAEGCPGRVDTGSGWVISGNRVVTAAHVIAGSTDVSIQWQGHERVARVIGVDQARDMAILSVKTGLRPLPMARGVHGQIGAVVGYPLGGPQKSRAARTGDVSTLWVPQLGFDGVQQRKVLSIRAKVQPGNSGGPLINQDGIVTGLVFASGEANAAYALPVSELSPMPQSINTGACLNESIQQSSE